MRTETTDIFLGLNWGIPSWKEFEVGLCPNSECMYPLMRNNKKIKYQKINLKEVLKKYE